MQTGDWIVVGLISICIVMCTISSYQLARSNGAMRRTLHRGAYRRGIDAGYRRCRREWVHARKVEMINADRLSEPRPDAGPPARISKLQINRRFDL